MKVRLFTFLMLAGVIVAFSACKKEESEARYLSYATVSDGSNKVLISDGDVQRLYVSENASGFNDWTNGKRLIVDYTVIREHESASMIKSYYVRLNNVYSILTKNPIKKSFLNTTAREDSIGHDPINIRECWFANDYLNIDFTIYRNNPNIKHFVNLVVDDSKTTATDVYVELRHNAYSDFPNIGVWGNVSFKISDYIVPPNNSVLFHLSRTTYNGEQKTDTMTYRSGLIALAPAAKFTRSLLQ
jgi:hypothetical protein